MKKFAICLAWDYKLPSAEKEIVDRIITASKNIKVECILANEFGFKLDKNYNVTTDKIGDSNDIEFALHMHFVTGKWDDLFSYFTLWNPVSLLFAWNNFENHMYNYKTYDDYLSSDSVNPVSHIKTLLNDIGRNYQNDIFLFPTGSESNIIKPDLKSERVRKKLFYCGTAWEKSAGAPVRHEKLFKSLEKEGILEIYGPKEANGLKPWDGYTSYIDEIPFDGKSIFKKINECGIVLALSSLEHQKAGVMSNRLFEATIGGAVVITDDNNFVNKYFGDSVIKVDNSGDWEVTSKEIINAVKWILSNLDKAQEMAIESQNICRNKFMFESKLRKIFDTLDDRKLNLKKQIFSKKEDEKVDIVFTWDKVCLQDLAESLEYINKQNYESINVVFLFDTSIVESAKSIINQKLRNDISYSVSSKKIFNTNERKNSPTYRIMTTGQMLLACKKKITSEYIAFMKTNDIWFSDHITTLKRLLEDNESKSLVHTSLSSEIIENNKIIHYANDYFYPYNIKKISNFTNRESMSMIMIKRDFFNKFDLNNLIYMDYLDFHYFILKSLVEDSLIFTNRKTYIKRYYLDQVENPQDFPIVNYDYQANYIKSFFSSKIEFYEIPKDNSIYIKESNLDIESVNHIVKHYILKQIKRPFNVFKQLFKSLLGSK